MASAITSDCSANDTQVTAPVRVWDVPVRLFHWLLVLLIIVMFVTGKLGGLAHHLVHFFFEVC